MEDLTLNLLMDSSAFLPSSCGPYCCDEEYTILLLLILVAIREIRGHLTEPAILQSSRFDFQSLFSVVTQSLESTDVYTIWKETSGFPTVALEYITERRSREREEGVVHVWNDAAKAFLGYKSTHAFYPRALKQGKVTYWLMIVSTKANRNHMDCDNDL